MKKILLYFIFTVTTVFLVSCSLANETSSNRPNPPSLPENIANAQPDGDTETQSLQTNSGILFVGQLNQFTPMPQYPFTYQGELTVDVLNSALKTLTNLDFNINSIVVNGDSAVVDWSSTSSLISGLGNVEQKEEFFVFDNVSLNYLMLDTVFSTVTNNYSVINVYYTMDGGSELVPTDMGQYVTFPLNERYMGSGYYIDIAYENSTAPSSNAIALTSGLWCVDGDLQLACIYMDGLGFYEAYYAGSNNIESSGYVESIELSDNGYYNYYLKTDDGEIFTVIQYTSEFSFYTDGPYGQEYFKIM